MREGGGDGRGAGGWGRGALLAGLLAGRLWALAPMAADLGQTLMSDEPTALVCLQASSSPAPRSSVRTRGDWALALAGGIAFGLAASMRSIVAVLMLPPLACFLIGGFRRKPVLPRLLIWGLERRSFRR